MNNEIEKFIGIALRSISASVPIAASWAQVWNEYNSTQQNRKLELFFQELEDLAKNQSIEIRNAMTATFNDEFPHLIEKTAEHVKKSLDEKKIHDNAVILVNALKAGSSMTVDRKLYAIETLNILTSDDIEVLRKIPEQSPIKVESILGIENSRHANIEAALGDLVVSLAKLESRGLIAESSSLSYMSVSTSIGDPGHWRNRTLSKHYVLLPFGMSFLGLISES